MPNSYRVAFTPAAQRDLVRLTPDTRKRIAEAIDKLQAVPRSPGVQALSGRQHELRIRVGDHRIIYEVQDRSRIVTVKLIAHRRDLYRRLNRL